MRRDQKRRAIILFTALLALAVGARHVTKRGVVKGGSSEKGRAESLRTVVPLAATVGDRSALVHHAREVLEGRADTPAGASDQPVFALVSLSRKRSTALVAEGLGSDLQSAVAAAAGTLASRASDEEKAQGRLKLDLVTAMGDERQLGTAPIEIERSLQGLWLPEIDLLLLPEELEARRLVSSDGELQTSRLQAYLMEGARVSSPEITENSIRRYRTVEIDSFAEGPMAAGPGSQGPPIRLFRGNDRSPEISPQALLAAARQGGDYLRSHQLADGSFVYSYDSKRNSIDDDDNLLRRAGTCYSLLQLSRATRTADSTTEATGNLSEPYLSTARRGLAALLDGYTRPVSRPGAAGPLEAVVSPGDELKLGGSALLLLALTEYQKTTGDTGWLERGQNLARFLEAQQEANGHFISKISLTGERFDFESGYYPGEAILALTRLHRIDGDGRWLEVAKKGADWLIGVRDADKKTADLAHDHWLLMALDELDQLDGAERYRTHAGRIAQAIVEAQRRTASHLDWVGSFYSPPRSTPTATRGEALVAMAHLARRHGQETRPVLRALLQMATFQRRCQFDDLNAMYLERPDLAVGGFRRSLTHYEIRIDYVQHNISSFLGLRELLLDSDRTLQPNPSVSFTEDAKSVLPISHVLSTGGIHVP